MCNIVETVIRHSLFSSPFFISPTIPRVNLTAFFVQILLDQSLDIGIHVTWESQLDYHICHNNWDGVSRLLDMIPVANLLDGSLQVSLDGLQTATAVGCNRESSFYGNYLYPLEELDAICLYIPNAKIFRFSTNIMCSKWLGALLEEKLARYFIFLKEYWEGTMELVPLLARAGFITPRLDEIDFMDDHINSSVGQSTSNKGGSFSVDSMQALYKVFIHHCSQYNLPFLLDLYLDHHKLAVDNNSVRSLLEAAVSTHHSVSVAYFIYIYILILFNNHHSSVFCCLLHIFSSYECLSL